MSETCPRVEVRLVSGARSVAGGRDSLVADSEVKDLPARLHFGDIPWCYRRARTHERKDGRAHVRIQQDTVEHTSRGHDEFEVGCRTDTRYGKVEQSS